MMSYDVIGEVLGHGLDQEVNEIGSQVKEERAFLGGCRLVKQHARDFLVFGSDQSESVAIG